VKYTAIVFAFAAMLSAAPAQALNVRSFVSGHGLDSNACTLVAPCRTFAVAFANTSAGGEIDVLDTAGYGPLTINKAISIVNDGSIGSVLVPSGGAAITINAGPNDAVSLRGLTIEGASVGHNGIQFATGKSLSVQKCVIRNFTHRGIEFAPSGSSSLAVSDTVIADNGGRGIIVVPTGVGPVSATLNRVEADNNTIAGFTVDASLYNGSDIIVTVADSVAANNGIGFLNLSQVGFGSPALSVFRSVVSKNNIGIQNAGTGGAVFLISQSAILGNLIGWSSLIGGSNSIYSSGDNVISFNGSNQGFNLQPATKQ
jgi:hypothetical protein